LRDDPPENESLLWANKGGGDIPKAQLNVKSQPTAFLLEMVEFINAGLILRNRKQDF
jgi:hypothetical protein